MNFTAFPLPRATLSGTVLALGLLAGCAVPSPSGLKPGDGRDAVVARLGEPVATWPTPDGGQRLEYSHMPAGLSTFMVDLDAQGRMLRWEQVLDEAHFDVIGPGLTQDEVRRRIGPPSETSHYWRPVEADTWRYRFQTVQRCIVFELSFDVKTHRTLEQGTYPPDRRCGKTMA